MKTLVIYDNTGKIFTLSTGAYTVPQGGIQHLEVEVPEGKTITGVDVSLTPHKAIIKDLPKTEVQLLQERIDGHELAIFELAELSGGGTNG